jgi:hypothetical protein
MQNEGQIWRLAIVAICVPSAHYASMPVEGPHAKEHIPVKDCFLFVFLPSCLPAFPPSRLPVSLYACLPAWVCLLRVCLLRVWLLLVRVLLFSLTILLLVYKKLQTGNCLPCFLPCLLPSLLPSLLPFFLPSFLLRRLRPKAGTKAGRAGSKTADAKKTQHARRASFFPSFLPTFLPC